MDVKGEHGGGSSSGTIFAHHPDPRCGQLLKLRAARLAEAAAVGDPRTAIEFHAAQSVSGVASKRRWRLPDRVVLGGVFSRAAAWATNNRMDPETVATSVRELGREARIFSGSDAIRRVSFHRSEARRRFVDYVERQFRRACATS